MQNGAAGSSAEGRPEGISRRIALGEGQAALEYRILEAEDELTEVEDALKAAHSYPAIPFPRLKPHKEGDGLPEASGVYFLWSEDTIDYVGKSVRLNERLRLGGHHVMRAHHYISFLLFDRKILSWAECYYIGVAKPPLNFAGSQ